MFNGLGGALAFSVKFFVLYVLWFLSMIRKIEKAISFALLSKDRRFNPIEMLFLVRNEKSLSYCEGLVL